MKYPTLIVLALLSTLTMGMDLKIAKIEPINHSFATATQYTHFVDLDIYLFPAEESEMQKLYKELEKAQELANKCKIKILIRNKYQLSGDESFREYEDLEFNGDRISEYERAIFNLTPKYSTGIVLVKSLDWTIGADGTVAVGYGPYIIGLKNMSAEENTFLKEKMSGHTVLGKARSLTTLSHEMGHSLFNLQHEQDPRNIMYPYGFGRSPKATFNEAQCAIAKANTPWVQKI